MTAGSAEHISRIVESSGYPHGSTADLEPRLSKAVQWTAEHVPADERTTVRSSPDAARLASLTEDEELWLRIFLDRLPSEPDLDAVTSVVYGVPKVARGLGFEDAPTDQVKADQKDFFRLLYNRSSDRARVLALGPEKVRQLLGAASGPALARGASNDGLSGPSSARRTACRASRPWPSAMCDETQDAWPSQALPRRSAPELTHESQGAQGPRGMRAGYRTRDQGAHEAYRTVRVYCERRDPLAPVEVVAQGPSCGPSTRRPVTIRAARLLAIDTLVAGESLTLYGPRGSRTNSGLIRHRDLLPLCVERDGWWRRRTHARHRHRALARLRHGLVAIDSVRGSACHSPTSTPS